MYKRKNHKVSHEDNTPIDDSMIDVIPYDTKVSNLLENLQKPYVPQYSGDIVDASYDGLMSHKAMLKSSTATVDKSNEKLTYLQELEKHRQNPEQEPNKQLDNPL